MGLFCNRTEYARRKVKSNSRLGIVGIYNIRVSKCGMRCSIPREDCNIWRMEGGTCILGKTFWSVEGSDSGVEAYVEQGNRKIQLKLEIDDR